MQTDRFRRVAGTVSWWVVIGSLLVPIWFGIVPAAAQDTEIIYNARTEVLFPAVVRFYAGVNAPASAIALVTLTVSQGTRYEQAFTFRPAEHILSDFGSAVELVYDWPLNEAVLPMPFRAIDYAWSVELTDGRTSEVVQQFQFVDAGRATWNSTNEGPVILHWSDTSLAGSSIQVGVERAYELLVSHVGTLSQLEFVLYDPGARLCQQQQAEDGRTRNVLISIQDGREYACSEDLFEATYKAGGVAFIKRQRYGYTDAQGYVVKALVREVYASRWQGKGVPAWFLAGLAGIYDLVPHYSALQLTRASERTDSLITLEDLSIEPPDGAGFMDRVLWDAESYLLVLYIADRWGADAPFELAQAVIEGPASFETVFLDYTGRDLRVFWDEWTRWLFGQTALNATRWTPYLAVTPTPTPTSTATVIVPTATLTMVPTYTPTQAYVPPARTAQPTPTLAALDESAADATPAVEQAESTEPAAGTDDAWSPEMIMALVLVGAVGLLLVALVVRAVFIRDR